jgi:uncharacterized protein YuzE
MARVRIRFDPTVNSLTILFGEGAAVEHLTPANPDSADEVMLMKDEAGQVIGIEIYFHDVPPGKLAVDFETAALRTVDELTGRAMSTVTSQ